jgi:hypothetical protein
MMRDYGFYVIFTIDKKETQFENLTIRCEGVKSHLQFLVQIKTKMLFWQKMTLTFVGHWLCHMRLVKNS